MALSRCPQCRKAFLSEDSTSAELCPDCASQPAAPPLEPESPKPTAPEIRVTKELQEKRRPRRIVAAPRDKRAKVRAPSTWKLYGKFIVGSAVALVVLGAGLFFMKGRSSEEERPRSQNPPKASTATQERKRVTAASRPRFFETERRIASNPSPEKARSEVTSELKILVNSLAVYQLDNGHFPSEDQGLSALRVKPTSAPKPQKWRGPYIDDMTLLIDAWGNSYQYSFPGKPNPRSFDLWSFGPDGRNGTEDDLRY